MQAKGRMTLMGALLAALLAACAGGSGSSGFITAGLENQLIDEALQDRSCVPGEGLTICPAGEEGASQPGTPGPDSPGASVDTTLEGANSLDCVGVARGAACQFSFSFIARGLPAESVYRVAVRSSDPLGKWTLAESPVNNGGVFTAVLSVPDGAAAIQIAILAFAEPEAVTTDAELKTLSSSGADLAFVEPPIAVASPQM